MEQQQGDARTQIPRVKLGSQGLEVLSFSLPIPVSAITLLESLVHLPSLPVRPWVRLGCERKLPGDGFLPLVLLRFPSWGSAAWASPGCTTLRSTKKPESPSSSGPSSGASPSLTPPTPTAPSRMRFSSARHGEADPPPLSLPFSVWATRG